MRSHVVQFIVAAGLLTGCSGGALVKPAEVFDERTGATVGALQEPLVFVESAVKASLENEKRTSFAYLGPLDWDRSGDSTYGLWLHIAPGNDRQVDDIRSSGAVTLLLDDGPLDLAPIDLKGMGGGPYRAIASWGQTAYYGADVGSLKRLAGSEKLVLHIRGTNGSVVEFTPTQATRATLTKFIRSRGITDD